MASAGSGKTTTFVRRIANMVNNHGVSPDEILAVTFTRKASEEMQKRLSLLIGEELANRVLIGTFHSIAKNFLESSLDPFSEPFKIAPDWWIMQKLNDICSPPGDKNHLGLNLGLKVGELATFISYQKANLITPKDKLLIDDTVRFADRVDQKTLKEAYSTFERLKEESGQITFDDMLVMFHNKLQQDLFFLADVQKRCNYVLIDEFQDTSVLMLKIIKLINEDNVFVVGDWRQSIYSFINANIENILTFKDNFKNTTLIELDKNFRSTQNIVHTSNAIISNSQLEKYKEFAPSNSIAECGAEIVLHTFETETSQASGVMQKICELRDNGTSLNEIAILVRTNPQTVAFQQVFNDANIPYNLSKSTSFFERREVLDLLSYARLSLDSLDNNSFERIYNTPNRFISKKFVEDLHKFASSRGSSLLDSIEKFPQSQEWKFKNGVNVILSIIRNLRHTINAYSAERFLKNLVSITGYKEHIEKQSNNAVTMLESLEYVDKLIKISSKFKTIKEFLNYIAVMEKKDTKKPKDGIAISTIHSAKGLEWDIVFVVNVIDGSLPHKNNTNIEEERRLFYVSTSRPRKQLYITSYKTDEDGSLKMSSPFFRELVEMSKNDTFIRYSMGENI